MPTDRVFKADIADLDSLRLAFEGVDVVLNLAADGGIGSADGMNTGWEPMLRQKGRADYLCPRREAKPLAWC